LALFVDVFLTNLSFISIYSWFRQSKIASFQRQLNIYGFVRIPAGMSKKLYALFSLLLCGFAIFEQSLDSPSSPFFSFPTLGPDKGGYYHEMFLRGKQFLTKHIKRSKVKGTGPRKSVPPELVPDLYAFAPIPSAPTSRSLSRSAQYPSPAFQQNSGTLSMLAGTSQQVGFQHLPVVPGSIAPLGSTSSWASRLSLHSLVQDYATRNLLLRGSNPLSSLPVAESTTPLTNGSVLAASDLCLRRLGFPPIGPEGMPNQCQSSRVNFNARKGWSCLDP
jgi:hypothetical protein